MNDWAGRRKGVWPILLRSGLYLTAVLLLVSGALPAFSVPTERLPASPPGPPRAALGVLAGPSIRPAGMPAADWFDLSASWTPSPPGERTFAAMAYDPALQGILIFGGFNNSLGGPDADTWLFSNGTWHNETPPGATQPPGRWSGLLAWDASNHEMVLFGGRNTTAELNDTWVYASGGWSQLLPTPRPSVRQAQFSVFAYDPTLRADYLYGGVCYLCGPARYDNDSWTFANGTWTNITASVAGGPTYPDSGAWDPSTGTVVAYTSNRSDCTGGASTMSFDGTTWNVTGTNSAPGPVEQGDGFVYDSLTGGMILFGATQGGGCSGGGQTWSYNNGTWVDLTANLSASPGGRCCESMAYDPTQKVVVLLGGTTNANGYVGDTWSFPAAPLVVNLTTSTRNGDAPFLVNLTANVTGGAAPLVYNWSFGDGTPNATTAVTHHTYVTNGPFALTFSTEDVQGRQVNRTLTIRVGAPLTSGASALPSSGEAPVRVNFTGSFSGGVAPYNFGWTFGDGTNGSGVNASHVYRAGGNYTATLTVQDGAQQTSIATVNVSIQDPLDVAVVTSPAVLSGDAPFVVNFSARPTGTEAPFSASWSFGDGAAGGSGLNVTHRYLASGTFDATVTVSDRASHEANATVVVHVASGLSAKVSSGKTVGIAPFPVTFVASSFGGVGPYVDSWSFGDGSPNATGVSVDHTYAQSGRFVAMLTTADATGAKAFANVSLHIVAPAVVTAHASVVSGITPLTVDFTSSTTGGLGPLKFAWSFGDGATATGENQSHRYVGAHTYTAGVTVSDPLNESVDASVSVDVYPTFVATLSVDANPIDLGQSVNFTGSAIGGAGGPEYAWRSLPPGCSASNGPDVSCTPTVAGSYNVTLVATDLANDTTNASVALTVVGPSGPTSSASAGTPTALWVLAGATLGGGALGGAVALIQRRRPPSPGMWSTEPTAAPAGSASDGPPQAPPE